MPRTTVTGVAVITTVIASPRIAYSDPIAHMDKNENHPVVIDDRSGRLPLLLLMGMTIYLVAPSKRQAGNRARAPRCSLPTPSGRYANQFNLLALPKGLVGGAILGCLERAVLRSASRSQLIRARSALGSRGTCQRQ
jgi:hypothetical protein